MKNKRLLIGYWIATGIFALWLLADGVSGVLRVEAGKESLMQLGYPLYLLTIAGIAKLCAAVAVLQTRFRTIKEWAYAGYAITCIGAAASWYAIDNMTNATIAIVFLLLMFIPYILWRKI